MKKFTSSIVGSASLLAFLMFFSPGLYAQGWQDCQVQDDDFYGGYLDCDNCECGGNYYEGTCHDCGGGWACSSASPNNYLVAYNDSQVDGSGNLELWATTSNSDGTYGEGTLFASVSGSYPDGTQIPTTTANSAYAPTVTASVSAAGSSLSSMIDNGNGSIIWQNEIDWVCGTYGLASIIGKIGISRRTFMFSSMSAGICIYTLACPAGQTPTCSTSTFQKAPPCYETYFNDSTIFVKKSNSLSCFGFGSAVGSYTQGTCD